MKMHERFSAAVAALTLAAAPIIPACGSDEPEVSPIKEVRPIAYCEPNEVVCVDGQSIDTGFADVTAEVRVGNVPLVNGTQVSCFHPFAAKDTFIGAAPVNRRRVPDEQTNGVAANMQDPITLDPASTKMLRVTKNGAYTLTAVQDSGNGHAFCVQTQDKLVTAACINAVRAAEMAAAGKGERDFEAEDNCDFDPSIQVDCEISYDGSVQRPQRNSCDNPEQGIGQTRQALGLPSTTKVRFTGQRVFPRGNR